MKVISYATSKILLRYHFLLLYIFRNHYGFLRSLARTTPFPEVRKKAWLLTGIKVGEGAYINHSITILDSEDTSIVIGERVALSPNIIIITNSSPNNSCLAVNNDTKKYVKKGSVVIGNDTWVGAGSIIQPGVKIGKRCIIGSMSNVTKDIPDDTLAYGNPARIIRKL
jgi:acetyltransferase-like isoleucine patch superfamily enzyme